MNRILVVGATGNVGRQVVCQLAAMGVRVRALVRNPDTAGLPAEVEVVRGDLTAADTVEEGLEGVDAVFLVWTAPAQAAAPALERIVRKAQRVVYLSAPYKTAHPMFQSRRPNAVTALHMEVERLIETSGGQWTFLRPGMFASNARFWWGPQIRAGDVVRWPYVAAPTAPIHERDIAAVAVRALCDEGHAGAEYVLTGPESLSQCEQILTIGEAIGRSLRVEEVAAEEARQGPLSGMPAFIANMLLDAWEAAIGRPALVTSTVAEITGWPARTFREWASDHAAEFHLAPARPGGRTPTRSAPPAD